MDTIFLISFNNDHKETATYGVLLTKVFSAELTGKHLFWSLLLLIKLQT